MFPSSHQLTRSTNLIQTFPQEFAGVAGSFVQVLFQIGAAVGNAAQAGFLGTGKSEAALADWTGSRNSFFFTSSVIAASGILFALLFRHDKMPAVSPKDDTAGAEEQRENGLDAEARAKDVPTIN